MRPPSCIAISHNPCGIKLVHRKFTKHAVLQEVTGALDEGLLQSEYRGGSHSHCSYGVACF
jgi:hypothetical protein